MKEEEAVIKISTKSLRYIIFGIIIVALLVIGFIAMNSGNKAKTNENPVTDNPAAITPSPADSSITASAGANHTRATNVEILSSLLETDKANDKHKTISGRVQNTGNASALSVIVYAKIYDANDKLIATEQTRPLFNDLSPGQISQYIISFYENLSRYELSVDWIDK